MLLFLFSICWTWLCLFFQTESIKHLTLVFFFPLADIGTCAITAIPFEKSKVLFGLEEMEEFSMVDETDAQAAAGDLGRSTAPLEKWGWIMFECGIENLTVKGKVSKSPRVGILSFAKTNGYCDG